MFKRVKSKPAQRTRPSSPEQDANDAADSAATGEDSPSTLAIKLKNKVKRAKPKSRLSFGGDEEEEGSGEVFQVKKSSLSQKVALGKHPANLPSNLDQASISPSRGPTYDKAYLNELKANTPSTRARIDPYEADISMDVGDISMDSIESVDVFEESGTYIPSESSIKVAKERRERVRKTGAAGEDDFISLTVSRRGDEPQGPHPDSRLVREEDELGEGDDEFAEYTSAQERIALGKKSRKVEAAKRRDTMKEMIADAEEVDDETMQWENEQLRRGGHQTSEPSSSTPKVKQAYKAAPIPPATTIPTLNPAIDRLSQQLAKLATSHATNTAALNSLAQERAEVDSREKEMREMVGKAEEKRAWFGSFREWLESVAGFLDEKYPLLEKLEEEHISLLRERFDMISTRRRAEDEDDLSAFIGPLPIPPPSDSEPEQTDELGRIIPKPNPAIQKIQRRAARQARRQARQRRRETEEGYSTDSELPSSDQTSYRAALASLASRTKDVLADVKAEEFRDPAKGGWAVWRERFTESYVGAWGGLGVVSVWEFWARLECVGWDCIEDPRSLHSFRWYEGLYEYSRPGIAEGGSEDSELGPDGDLVSSMITTAVIPNISKILEAGALDVYSDIHIRRAVDLVEEVEASVEAGSVKLQMLFKAVLSTFEKAISETESLLARYVAVAPSAPAFNLEAIPSRTRFLMRRLKLLNNIVRWRKFTGERFGVGQLLGRIVQGCMLAVADSGWEVGGADVLRKAATLLPPELISPEVAIRLNIR